MATEAIDDDDVNAFSFYAILYQNFADFATAEDDPPFLGGNYFSISTHTEVDPETIDLISTPLAFLQLKADSAWSDVDVYADSSGNTGDMLDFELVIEGTVDFIPDYFRWRLSKKDEVNIDDWGFGAGFAYEGMWLGYLKNDAGNDRVNLSGYLEFEDIYVFTDTSYLIESERFEGEVGVIFPEMEIFGGAKPVLRYQNIFDEEIYSVGIVMDGILFGG